MHIGKRWLGLIWILVGGLVWWSLRDLNWGAVWQPLSRLHPVWLVGLLLLDTLILSCFGLPWWMILKSLGQRVSLRAIVSYRIAGFGWSYFIPGPFIGGEPFQVLALERLHGVPVSAALASVALDRLLEWFINLIIVILGLGMLAQLMALSPLLRGLFVAVTLGVVGALLAYLMVVWRGARPLAHLLGRWPRVPPRLSTLIAETEHQLAQAGARQLGLPLLVVAASWVLVLLDYWLLMAMLGQQLTIWQLLAAITINRVAFLVPVPGGVGAVEASQVLVMRWLGLDPAIGLAHSLVVRMRDVLTGGAGLLWSMRVIAPSTRRQS